MPMLTRRTFPRLMLIALYAMAMLTAGGWPMRHPGGAAVVITAEASLLPGGDVMPLCQHDQGEAPDQPGKAPADHSCCDACLFTQAPGLDATEQPAIMHPPVAGIVFGKAPTADIAAIRRMQPASRGPPVAA